MELMPNNKKGQIQLLLGVGGLIVVGVIILMIFITGGLLLNYLKNNLVLILGATILLMTLIFGLKAVITDPKPLSVGIFGFLILMGALMMIGSYAFTNTQLTTSFFDSDLGMVTLKTASPSLLGNIFGSTSQIFYQDKSAYTVGQSITGRSAFFCMTPTVSSPAEAVKVELLVYIYPPAGQAGPPQQKIFTQTTTAGRDIKYVNWNIPTTSAGVYKVSDCWTCTTDNRRVCTQDYYEREIQVTQTATSCPSDSNRGVKWSSGTTTGVNFIRWNEWDTYTLSAGQCVQRLEKRNYMTVCNDGYVCSGTQSQDCAGQTTCQKAIIENPNPECNAPMTISCASGSSVITQNCIDGKFYTTGNVCPESKDQCARDEFSTCDDGSSVTTATCAGTPKVLTSTGKTCPLAVESCHSKSYTCGTFNGVNCGSCPAAQDCISNICENRAMPENITTSCETTNTCSVTSNNTQQQTSGDNADVSKETSYDTVLIAAYIVVGVFVALIIFAIIKTKKTRRR